LTTTLAINQTGMTNERIDVQVTEDNCKLQPARKVLEEFLSTFVYKPGWSFMIVDPWNAWKPNIELHSHVILPTRDDPSTLRPFHGSNIVPLSEWSRDQCRAFVLDFILQLERHEVLECFMDNDTRPFDPHVGQMGAFHKSTPTR
jgi:hypothetical protein